MSQSRDRRNRSTSEVETTYVFGPINRGLTEADANQLVEDIRELGRSTPESSIWIALALAAFTLAGTLLITLLTVALSRVAEGEFIAATVAGFILGLVLVYVHAKTGRELSERAEAVIREFQSNLYEGKLGAAVDGDEGRESQPEIVIPTRTGAEPPAPDVLEVFAGQHPTARNTTRYGLRTDWPLTRQK